MRYLITLTDNREIIYDTSESTLQFTTGEDVLKDKYEMATFDTHKRSIKLVLGMACNFKCSYCHQGKEKIYHVSEEQLKSVCEELNKEDISKTNIFLWGGEPLLYLNEIRYLVKHLKPLKFTIITNGSLLTKELIDEFYQENIVIGVSHDIINQHLRGKCPISEKPEVFKYLFTKFKNRVSINPVFTSNITISEIKKWVYDKIGVEDVLVAGEGYVTGDLKVDNISEFLYKDLVYGRALEHNKFRTKLFRIHNSIVNRTKLETIGTKCHIDNPEKYKVKSITGTPLTCHLIPKAFNYVKTSQRPKCLECIAIHTCRGVCPAIPLGEEERYSKSCSTHYETFIALFKFLILANTGSEVISIRRA